MIKIFTLLNLTGLFLFDLLFLSGVSISQDTPATMAAGSEIKVTVTIHKEQLSGFAKLQIDLPAGFSASAIETRGASFTFADGKAKFIWMALPSQPEFKVTYTLSASATAGGSASIGGKFSYIEENERKAADIPVSTITITGGAAVAAQPAPATNAEDVASAASATPAPPATATATQSFTLPAIAPVRGPGSVVAARTITPVTATEMLVEVTVHKGNVRGFGKLQETIPAGFTAVEKSNGDAIFTTADRVVKFVWLNLPTQADLKVAYLLRANSQPEGEYSVNGEFGYLLNDETQKAVVGTTNFFTGTKALEAIAAAEAAAKNNAGTGTINNGGTTEAATPANNEDVTATLNDLSVLRNQYESLQPMDAGLDGRINVQKQKIDALMVDLRTGKIDAATARGQASVIAKAREDLNTQIEKQKTQAATQQAVQQTTTAQTAAPKPRTSPSGSVPAPETGITYKVQISAAHREVGAAYFAERHHYTGEFSIERHDGWIKYVTGRHAAYGSARDQRQSYVAAGYDFPGPFVTAYNNGERITVQEALMISNQKWVQ
ncbi:MAG: hypothetical protein QM724_11300 [Flavobacteriales bacterium]